MNPTFVRRFVLPWLMRRTWPEVQRIHAELEASQWLAPDEVRAIQRERLRSLIDLASVSSPFYRKRLSGAGLDGARLRDIEDLQQIPVLEKKELQEQRESILVEGADKGALVFGSTGGTTGEPTRYYWDDPYWCASSAVSLRAYGMAGFQAGDRHCMVWGTAFHDTRRAAWREKLEQWLRNVLVVPGFDLSNRVMGMWARRVARQRPVLVEGYTSLLVLFGTFLTENGIEDIRPRSVISSAEPLPDHQRELIGRSFGAKVFDRYGSREVGCIAQECDRGGLHVNSEHVLVEILQGDRRAPPGETGEIVVTCLSNRVFPFIRYRIGDVGRLCVEPCTCGRGLPLMRISEGRVSDLVTTGRGTWLPGMFFPHFFKECRGVSGFQVRQAADRSVRILIVKSPEWDAAGEEKYRREIAAVLGEELPVSYEYVDDISRTTSGKLQLTISAVPVDLAGGPGRHESGS